VHAGNAGVAGLVKTEPILRLGPLAGSRMSASEILAPRGRS
jgi:hypothetical protein